MYYYAKYSFERRPEKITEYILRSSEGRDVENLTFAAYVGNEKNNEMGIAGQNYIRLSVPRNPNIRKYFAYCIENKPNEVLTSVEGFNEKKRTFGDCKNIGLRDLILIQMSSDLKKMDMYFIEGNGGSRQEKQYAFQMWNDGDVLEIAE